MGNSLENQFNMRGEFRGDFTRDTFNADHTFTRVLMQQGRVQLDADWNEQVSIIVHYLRSLASDLIGPHGAPADIDGQKGTGFQVVANTGTVKLSPGVYYVNGIRCESRPQDNKLVIEIDKKKDINSYLVYLDVWERHLSHLETDWIREVALNGPDTATRAKIEWQVKLQPVTKAIKQDMKKNYEVFLNALEEKRPGSGRMRARARQGKSQDTEPCLIAPESRYRGPENQLYRVEIHNSGKGSKATFKWSHNNSSSAFRIVEPISGPLISLEHLGRDNRCALEPNDWVEICDDDYALKEDRYPLLQIDSVDHDNRQVQLTQTPGSDVGFDMTKHPYLRLWDHKTEFPDGVPLKEGTGGNGWIDLEDGIQIQFLKATKLAKVKKAPPSRHYFAGDYWLIPARTITGDVEWPGPSDNPDPLPAHGVVHHYAPLAMVTRKASKELSVEKDLRRQISRLWE